MGGFPQHVILGITAIAVMLGIMSFTPNRLIRGRLRLSIVLLVAYLAIDLGHVMRGQMRQALCGPAWHGQEPGPDAGKDAAPLAFNLRGIEHSAS